MNVSEHIEAWTTVQQRKRLRAVMVTCPYCGLPAALVTGKLVYPYLRDLHKKQFWLCEPCDAYVGCHPGSARPLGRLANSDLRRERKKAHAAFDVLWKSGKMSRNAAYTLLASELNIPYRDCHIGMFDIEMCKRVQEIMRKGAV